MDRWQQIDDLFSLALTLPPEARAAALDACPDTTVRREVASLLDHHAAAGAFIEEAVGCTVSAWAAASAEAAQTGTLGRRIGAYEVTGTIGQGGMGAVYRARRADGAFEHDVAIKVVRHGFETPVALDRFRQERQILARLTHADIARLLDGGTIQDERGVEVPYLVLEYVEGTAITTYCASRALSIDDRLTLFRRVLDAVLHAHQRLVVHRDLKPANILVTADGQPKLLDFGVAKLLTDGSEPVPAMTADGGAMLTPEYASPEQVRGEPITVATDVYALGAILYELLTDQKAHRFQTRAPAEIHRVVCDTPITRPSTAVASATPAATKLRRLLNGDLDTIVMKALHKEPARRYASVEQLSEDLRRYLAGLPVMARPDTAPYRAGKFVRRHKTLLAVTVLSLASLIAGLVISMQQTRIANQRFQDLRTLASRLLTEVEPAVGSVAGTAKARQLIATMSTEYLDRLRADAGNDRQLLVEIAEGYYAVGAVEGSLDEENFGDYEASMRTHAKALALVTQLLDAGHFDTRLAKIAANVHIHLGNLSSVKSSRAEAMDHFQTALAVTTRALDTSPDDLMLKRIALSAEVRMGDTLAAIGRASEATELFERALARLPDTAQRANTITTRARLAGALRESANPERAVALFRSCIEDTRQALERSPRSTGIRHTLTLLQADLGLTLGGQEGPSLRSTSEALAAYRSALETGKVLIDASAGDTFSMLAWAEGAVGFGTLAAEVDPSAATAPLGDAVERLASLLARHANDDGRLLKGRAHSALSRALGQRQRFTDARTHGEAATSALQALVDRDREHIGYGDALVMARVHLGEALAGLADRAGAEAQLRSAVQLAERHAAATPDRPRAHTLREIARTRLANFLSTPR